jgi:uncharacterized membrane protein
LAKSFFESASIAFEVLGVAAIVIGAIVAFLASARILVRDRDGMGAYDAIKRIFGRSVLMGLEILVAADIIRTVAVDPTLDNLYVLGLLVLIRTFLSWSLDVELEGMWPWRRYAIADRNAGAAAPDNE